MCVSTALCVCVCVYISVCVLTGLCVSQQQCEQGPAVLEGVLCVCVYVTVSLYSLSEAAQGVLHIQGHTHHTHGPPHL